jgi:3-dehydroquinate synthase
MVDTGDARYPVWVGNGEIDKLPERLHQLGLSGTVYLITDNHVMEAYGDRVAHILDSSGIAGASYVVPAGERSKRPRVAEELYGWLAENNVERNDTIIALGGGMVGDLAGYVAATYLRGIPLVQLPTTVLAMSDSSIGGKVAVDLSAGKNLVGSFHQPRAVIADTEALSTLPRRVLIEGFAEVIKHALILDPQLLVKLERNAGTLSTDPSDTELLTTVLTRSARLKALIVSTDPTERGLRTILNYGHTIGHAIEAIGGYNDYLHGEAVSIGMVGAARIGERIGLIDSDTVARQSDVLRAFGLPLTAPGLNPNEIIHTMQLDKKIHDGRLRFVLLESLGRAVVRDDIPEQLVEEVIKELTTS